MARRWERTMRGERDGENEGERQREHMVPKTRESEDERREAHELENFRVDGGVRGAERCHSAEVMSFGVLIGTTESYVSFLTDEEMAPLEEENSPRILCVGGWGWGFLWS